MRYLDHTHHGNAELPMLHVEELKLHTPVQSVLPGLKYFGIGGDRKDWQDTSEYHVQVGLRRQQQHVARG